jgi:hypothetical protein
MRRGRIVGESACGPEDRSRIVSRIVGGDD